MINDQFWQPDKQTQSSIRRGNKLFKDYLDRKSREYAALRAATRSADHNLPTVVVLRG